MRSYDSATLLFCKYDMFSILEGQKRAVIKGIDQLSEEQILKTPQDSLIAELEHDRFTLKRTPR